VIAVDTNILVYAERVESPWFRAAATCLIELAQGPSAWGLPWHCIHEFYGVVTNPRIWKPATPPERAIAQIEAWLESPHVVLLNEGPKYWETLKQILKSSATVGPPVHDARIAAVCVEHGVSTLWSADRDFSRFSGLKVVNPLVTTGR